MKKKEIAQIGYGSAVLLETLIAFAKSRSAADVMYYICRVFGLALPLPIAIAVRILLLTTAGAALSNGLRRVAPVLYRKLKQHNPQMA